MLANHKAGLAALAAAMAFASGVSAAPFDAHRCSAIQNVDLPYDVSIASDHIAFNGSGRHIVVAPAYMEVDGHRFADAALSPAYYQNVRGFLHSAGAFPKAAAEFGKTAFLPDPSGAKQNFLTGITAMCHSILNLADDQKRMHSAFADFVSPVKITLSTSHSL
ncbi:MAG TPA: hypothetical protein VHW69_00550 [Rhizomicrobium sp.]|jgi:hypothetical protein|nr:hypothetical protein [Rhizomicrobium sp.]